VCVKKPQPIAEARERVPPLVSRSRTFSEAWADFTRDVDLDELDIDPDEVFAGARDQSVGARTSRPQSASVSLGDRSRRARHRSR